MIAMYEQYDLLLDRALSIIDDDVDNNYDNPKVLLRDLKVGSDKFLREIAEHPALTEKWVKILDWLEANAYQRASLGKTREGIAIANLEHNFGWRKNYDVNATVSEYTPLGWA